MNITLLQQSLANLQNKLAELTVDPKPTYSVDGQSVSWNEYLRTLTDGIKAINELLGIADPVERRTVAA